MLKENNLSNDFPIQNQNYLSFKFNFIRSLQLLKFLKFIISFIHFFKVFFLLGFQTQKNYFLRLEPFYLLFKAA